MRRCCGWRAALPGKTGARNLCLAGGVALNCVANGKVLRDESFDNIWISARGGPCWLASAGAALAAHQIFKGVNSRREQAR